MHKRTKNMIVAGLAVAAAAASLYFGFAKGRSPKINLDLYEVLGAVTAEETAKLLGNKGQVLAIARDTGQAKNPSVEAELKALQQTLKKRPGMSVVVEKVQIPPMQMMALGGGVPVGQLFKALETHANAAAAVLFFGFPQLADAESEALKKRGVKIVVVSSNRSYYKRLLEQQVIHLVIAPRPEPPPPDAPTPRTVRERFDQENIILTSANPAPPP